MDPAAGILETLVTNYGPPGLIIAYLLYDRAKLMDRINVLTDKFITVATSQAEAGANSASALNRLADGISRTKGD